jgi:hypothetical protein
MISSYPQSGIDLLTEDGCLAFNQTICNPYNRIWNDSIGYNYNSVYLGLLHLTNQVVSTHLDLAAGAAKGAIPDPGRYKFLDSVLEPDYLDGWEQFKIRLSDDTTNVVRMRTVINLLIFILQVTLIVIGNGIQFLLVGKIMNNYRFTDHCIHGILNGLPSHVKKLPQVEKALRDGGLLSHDLVSEKRAAVAAAAVAAFEKSSPKRSNAKTVKAAAFDMPTSGPQPEILKTITIEEPTQMELSESQLRPVQKKRVTIQSWRSSIANTFGDAFVSAINGDQRLSVKGLDGEPPISEWPAVTPEVQITAPTDSIEVISDHSWSGQEEEFPSRQPDM